MTSLLEIALLEAQSFSTVVDEVSWALKQDIVRQVKNSDRWYKDQYGVHCLYDYEFQTDACKKYDGKAHKINVTIYDFPTYELHLEYYMLYPLNCDYNINNGAFDLKLLIINNNTSIGSFNKVIRHEVKHWFQMWMDDYKDIPERYKNAVVYQNQNNEKWDAMLVAVYYCSKRELDAKLEEFYEVLLQKNFETYEQMMKDAPIKQIIDLFQTSIDTIGKMNPNSDEDNECFDYYKCTKNWAYYRCVNGLDYLRKKSGRLFYFHQMNPDISFEEAIREDED